MNHPRIGNAVKSQGGGVVGGGGGLGCGLFVNTNTNPAPSLTGLTTGRAPLKTRASGMSTCVESKSRQGGGTDDPEIPRGTKVPTLGGLM